MIDTWHYTLVKLIKCAKARMKPNVNCAHEVIMWDYRVISGKECIARV